MGVVREDGSLGEWAWWVGFLVGINNGVIVVVGAVVVVVVVVALVVFVVGVV